MSYRKEKLYYLVTYWIILIFVKELLHIRKALWQCIRNVPQSSTIIYSLSHCRFSDNRYLLHFSSDRQAFYPYPSQHFYTLKSPLLQELHCTSALPCQQDYVLHRQEIYNCPFTICKVSFKRCIRVKQIIIIAYYAIAPVWHIKWHFKRAYLMLDRILKYLFPVYYILCVMMSYTASFILSKWPLAYSQNSGLQFLSSIWHILSWQ